MSRSYLSLAAAILCITLAGAGPAHAAQDFTRYQTHELTQMREQARYWDQTDRGAYRSEMQTRMQAMSSEERAALRAERGGQSQGQGQGSMRRLQDGSGGGQGPRQSAGEPGGRRGGGGGRR